MNLTQTIEESLYRWQQHGWTVLHSADGQFVLTHPQARQITIGTRTQFQTVGSVQGEMQRALRDGAAPLAKSSEPSATDALPKRMRKKTKTRQTGPGHGASGPAEIATPRRPLSAFQRVRRMPQQVEEPIAAARRLSGYENSAWELAYLRLRLKNTADEVIDIMRRRFESDEHFRSGLVQSLRKTSQAEIAAIRSRVRHDAT